MRSPVTWVEYGLTIRAAFFTVASMPRRTALIVAVPEAEPYVGALRLAHDPSAALGAPAHITILFPFVSPQSVDEAAIDELVGTHTAFDFQLTGVDVFPEG